MLKIKITAAIICFLLTASLSAIDTQFYSPNATSECQSFFLGTKQNGVSPTFYRKWLGGEQLQYLTSHIVKDEIVFPGAGFVDIALSAAADNREHADEIIMFDKIVFDHALVLGSKRLHIPVDLFLNTSIRFYGRRASNFDVYMYSSLDRKRAHVIASGGKYKRAKRKDLWPNLFVKVDAPSVDRELLYNWLEDCGLSYGRTFRQLINAMVDGGKVEAFVRVPETPHPSSVALNPAILDSAFHAVMAIVYQELVYEHGFYSNKLPADIMYVPYELEKITFDPTVVLKPGTRLVVKAELEPRSKHWGASSLVFNMQIEEESNGIQKPRPILTIEQGKLGSTVNRLH